MATMIFNPLKSEGMSSEDLRRLQGDKLLKQIRYVYENSEFYRSKVRLEVQVEDGGWVFSVLFYD